MASALLVELKIVASKIAKSQIKDAVGCSWASLAAEGLSRERYRDSAGRSGSRSRKGGGTGDERGAGGEGGGGGGVLNSENNGRIRWQPSMIERMS